MSVIESFQYLSNLQHLELDFTLANKLSNFNYIRNAFTKLVNLKKLKINLETTKVG